MRRIWIVQGLVGLVLLGLAYHTGVDRALLLISGAKVQGTVVGYEERRFLNVDKRGMHRADISFMPVVEFNVGDRNVRFTDWKGTASPGGASTVQVLYSPNNPTIAMIDRPILNWVPWAPFLAVGALLTIVAIRGWRRNRY